VKLENFTAFASLDFEPGPGVNILIGTNGTGKTHLMKVIYAACQSAKRDIPFVGKLTRVFSLHEDWGRQLVHLSDRPVDMVVEVARGDAFVRAKLPGGSDLWQIAERQQPGAAVSSAYIPAKEMLANAPGFESLYQARELAFEEVYPDIISLAYLPRLRTLAIPSYERLVAKIEEVIGGTVIMRGQKFFLNLSSGLGELEFALVSEGWRRLALLGLLIQNGSIAPESVLFWDEPEANLNPSRMGDVVDIMLQLARSGVQVFLATHDYVILKRFDLQSRPDDTVHYHTLYPDGEGGVALKSTDDYLQIEPNKIADTFVNLYDEGVRRALGGGPRR